MLGPHLPGPTHASPRAPLAWPIPAMGTLSPLGWLQPCSLASIPRHPLHSPAGQFTSYRCPIFSPALCPGLAATHGRGSSVLVAHVQALAVVFLDPRSDAHADWSLTGGCLCRGSVLRNKKKERAANPCYLIEKCFQHIYPRGPKIFP